jgi:hypothetical protein
VLQGELQGAHEVSQPDAASSTTIDTESSESSGDGSDSGAGAEPDTGSGAAVPQSHDSGSTTVLQRLGQLRLLIAGVSIVVAVVTLVAVAAVRRRQRSTAVVALRAAAPAQVPAGLATALSDMGVRVGVVSSARMSIKSKSKPSRRPRKSRIRK